MVSVQAAALCYYRTVFWTSSISIAIFLYTLFRVLKGKKHSFLIVLIVMLIISNLCAILSNTFARVWIYSDFDKRRPFMYLQGTASGIRDVTFNLAHWIFAFKYWVIAIDMQYLLERK